MEFRIEEYLTNLEGLANHLDTVATECDHYAGIALTDEDRDTDKANAAMTRTWAAMVRGEMSLCRFMYEQLSPGMVDKEAECVFMAEPSKATDACPTPSSKAADLLALAKSRGAFNWTTNKRCFGEKPAGFGTPNHLSNVSSGLEPIPSHTHERTLEQELAWADNLAVAEVADVQPGDCKEG